jgi:hypothetical protein
MALVRQRCVWETCDQALFAKRVPTPMETLNQRKLGSACCEVVVVVNLWNVIVQLSRFNDRSGDVTGSVTCDM